MDYTEKQLRMMPQKNGFRLRGIEMTRLETFMDAAFAFATTMLVISVGEVPKNYSELILALKEIPSFLSSFCIMMIFWLGHRSWSRRYGLEDTITVLISISLIFVLLVYIYPLRLIFSALFAWISGGWLPSRFTLHSSEELTGLFIIYGVGLTAIAGLMALLHIRARSVRNILKLNDLEIIKTNLEITSYVIVSLTGIISALLAWLMPPNINILAGCFYATIPITLFIVEFYYKKKEKRLLVSKDEYANKK